MFARALIAICMVALSYAYVMVSSSPLIQAQGPVVEEETVDDACCYDVSACFQPSSTCSSYIESQCEASSAWVMFNVDNRQECQDHEPTEDAGPCTQTKAREKCAEQHICTYDEDLGQCVSSVDLPVTVPLDCTPNPLVCP